MFDVLVNGHKTADFNEIGVANIPQIQSSTTERDKYTIPQRDGDISNAYFRRTSAYITVTYHAKSILTNKRVIKSVFCNQVNEKLRTSMEFPTISIINRKNGTDEYDSYFNIRNATITEESQNDDNYGRVTIQYEVEPFEYMIDDTVIVEVIEFDDDPVTLTVTNDGDLCKPLIKAEPQNESQTVQVSRFGAKIKIDSRDYSQIEFPLGHPLHPNTAYVDTDLMYTYGHSYGAGIINYERYFTHDYDNLWVPSGTHTITLEPSTNSNEYKTKVTIYLRRGYAI